MFEIDFNSRKSIYEQVVDNIKELIIAGIIKPEQQIPSVRELSKMLTVNPNTVQKSYAELDRTGYIYSIVGKGTFVMQKGFNPPDARQLSKPSKIITSEIRELLYLGFDKDTIANMIAKILDEESTNQNISKSDDDDAHNHTKEIL